MFTSVDKRKTLSMLFVVKCWSMYTKWRKK